MHACLVAYAQFNFSYTVQNPLTKEWCCLEWAVASHINQLNETNRPTDMSTGLPSVEMPH